MSQHMFCLTTFPITKAQVRRLEKIADDEGVDYVYCGDRKVSPASGWFAGPNRGFPFDDAMSGRVRAAIEAAGLEGVLR